MYKFNKLQLKILKNAVIVFICTLILGFSTIPVYGASGDVAGKYYQTDIQTTLYYSPITSYNIGGQTVIDAEILNWHYGFDVYWLADERRLEITDKGGMFNSLQAMSGELCEQLGGKVGEVVGNYFKTDIVTELNGREITSYNIGGRTCILAEEMRNFGYDVIWDSENRTLNIIKPSDFYKITTDYGVIATDVNFKREISFFMKMRRGIILSDDLENNFELSVPSQYKLFNMGGHSYVKLSDLCAVLNAQCVLVKSSDTSHTEWVNGISYDEDYFTYCIKLTYDSAKPELKPEQSVNEYYEFEEFSDFDNCYEIYYNIELDFNGEKSAFYNTYGGRKFEAGVMVIDGEIYIPTYMVAVIMGYNYAY